MPTPLETLFLPFECKTLPFECPALFLGAGWHPVLETLSSSPDLWQPFRPAAQALETRAFKVLSAYPQGKTYALALVDLPKQVEEARHWLAMALGSLVPGGILVAAAANDANGARLEKWFAQAGLVPSSLSKNKCRVVWAKRPAALSDAVIAWKQAGRPHRVNIGDGIEFISQPGLFSWDRIDPGSSLLAEHIPPSLVGVGADFGAGIGYLSHQILQRCSAVTRLYVLEADFRALSCARANLPENRDIVYDWVDLSKPVDLPPLDFIVTNPPFHIGKKTDVALGISFIQTAACHLKKGGILLLVANAHLPYEAIMENEFTNIQTLVQKDGFKIIRALK